MIKPNGFVLYEGPSKIDGSPIVVIVTGTRNKSANVKTADMLQTWIMRSDMPPHEAKRQGLDSAICGNCIFSGSTPKDTRKPCYVLVWQAPLAVYKAYKRGSYPRLPRNRIPEVFSGRKARIGSYGDPYVVPVWLWHAIVEASTHRTGYTHQWRSAPYLKTLIMASVDSEEEYKEATALGWRTFRTRGKFEPIARGEIMCPASKEAGNVTTCADCRLCNGSQSEDSRKSISIIIH